MGKKDKNFPKMTNIFKFYDFMNIIINKLIIYYLIFNKKIL